MDELEINFSEPREPKKKDKLFTTNKGSIKNTACLNFFNPKDKYGFYADGYKKAGDLLVDHVNTHRRDQDYLLYPIAFLYRRYLELSLKDIILRSNRLFKTAVNFIKYEHRLEDLWKVCRSIMEKLRRATDDENCLDAIEERIKEFAKRDPFATAFAYPEDKKGKQSHPDVDQIDIKIMADRIKEIALTLDGTRDQISYLYDFSSQKKLDK